MDGCSDNRSRALPHQPHWRPCSRLIFLNTWTELQSIGERHFLIDEGLRRDAARTNVSQVHQDFGIRGKSDAIVLVDSIERGP